jgi:hypothetical protein
MRAPMRNELSLRSAAGRPDDLREARARPDRIGEALALDVSAAAALGANEAACGQLGERAPHRMPVDAESGGDLDLARKTVAGPVGSERNRLLEVIGDSTPEGDAVRGLGRCLAWRRH